MGKTLVLGVDGLLIRNKHIQQEYTRKCVNYVKTKLPNSKSAEDVNKVLHLVHGHTGRGLKLEYGIDTRDFNNQIYEGALMSLLIDQIYSQEFQQNAEHIHQISRQGWDIKLITSAPSTWVLPVALAIGDNVGFVCEKDTLDISTFKKFSGNNLYLFVDHSLKNLGVVRKLKNWLPVHFTTEKNEYIAHVDSVEGIVQLASKISNVLKN